MDCVRWHLNKGKNFLAELKKRLRTKESEDYFLQTVVKEQQKK